MRGRGTWATAVLALGVVHALVVLGPASAASAPGGEAIEVSVDGATWAATPTTPMFDPAALWVPGDVETGTLWVRTSACATASGSARLVVGPQEAELAEDLTVRTRVDGGPWATGTVFPGFVVGSGGAARLDAEVTFDPASGNESQSRAVPLAVTVSLACDAAPPVQGPGGQASGGGTLPRTGIEVVRALTAATALVVAGAWLVLAGRRRAVGDG